MEKEDILLGVKLERLEIEPVKLKSTRSVINPFTPALKKCHTLESAISTKEAKCDCSLIKKNNNTGIIKKKSYKILKEPVLKLLKDTRKMNTNTEIDKYQESLTNRLHNQSLDSLNLCTLVRNCNQLKISPSSHEAKSTNVNNSDKWWKHDIYCTQEYIELKYQTSEANKSSCSQQALNPPCDVTIDELASYFETLVHIPKKMSSMAEMMYI